MRKEERVVAERIASEVRRRRVECGWSQLGLAERAELSLNYVGMLERAERLPSFEVLIRLAGTLGTSVGAIVNQTGAATPEADPWLVETAAILRTLPVEARPVVLGMLRGASAAALPLRSVTKGSGVQTRRRPRPR